MLSIMSFFVNVIINAIFCQVATGNWLQRDIDILQVYYVHAVLEVMAPSWQKKEKQQHVNT